MALYHLGIGKLDYAAVFDPDSHLPFSPWKSGTLQPKHRVETNCDMSPATARAPTVHGPRRNIPLPGEFALSCAQLSKRSADRVAVHFGSSTRSAL